MQSMTGNSPDPDPAQGSWRGPFRLGVGNHGRRSGRRQISRERGGYSGEAQCPRRVTGEHTIDTWSTPECWKDHIRITLGGVAICRTDPRSIGWPMLMDTGSDDGKTEFGRTPGLKELQRGSTSAIVDQDAKSVASGRPSAKAKYNEIVICRTTRTKHFRRSAGCPAQRNACRRYTEGFVTIQSQYF